MTRRLLPFLVFLPVFVLSLLSFPVFGSDAQAQSNDLNGTYSVDIFLNTTFNNNQTWVLQQNGTTITGTGFGGPYTFVMNGTLVGSQLAMTYSYNELNYTGNFVGTVTNSGVNINGTWDSSFEQQGTFSATKQAPPPPPGKRDTATTVACNRGPAPADDFVCTATVGSKDAQAPQPTGEVVFSAQEGSFQYGNKCLLSPSSNSPSVSSCAVVYIQPTTLIPAGGQVPLTAKYGGDTTYNTSSGVPSGFTVVQLPKSPPVCFSSTPGSCSGLNADLPPTISRTNGIGNVLLSYFGASGIDQGTSRTKSFPIVRPKKPGEISGQVFYNIHLRDNPALRGLLPVPRVGGAFRNGVVSLGFVSGTVRFGQSKDIKATMTRPGLLVLGATGRIGVSNLNIRVTARAFRKGDRRPTSVYKTINVGIQP